MSEFLVFRLYAPMASWGDTAVGEMRPCRNEPGESGILGLLAAAHGIVRDDEASHLALREGYALTVAVLQEGNSLRDYHTAQVPSSSTLRKHPHRTRCDELSVDKDDLNTILSTRYYRQDSQVIVALESRASPPYKLSELKKDLELPKFTLYLGRKSCPLAAPLWPRIETAAHARDAFGNYLEALATHSNFKDLKWWDKFAQPGLDEYGKPLPIMRMHWGKNSNPGVPPPYFTVPRKDHLLSRKRWQFGDRIEYIALLFEKE